jgi:hypothetical protein
MPNQLKFSALTGTMVIGNPSNGEMDLHRNPRSNRLRSAAPQQNFAASMFEKYGNASTITWDQVL